MPNRAWYIIEDPSKTTEWMRDSTVLIFSPPGGSVVKNHLKRRRYRRHGFNPWVRKMPWRRKWGLSPVFLPRKSQGQRSLEGSIESQRVGHNLVTRQQYRCFTMVRQFLLHGKVNLPYVYMHMGYLYPPFGGFPSHLDHLRALGRSPPAIQQVFINYLFYTP